MAAVIWGALVAPKARWPLPIQVRLVVEVLLFGVAAGALVVAGQTLLAVVLGVAGCGLLGRHRTAMLRCRLYDMDRVINQATCLRPGPAGARRSPARRSGSPYPAR